MKKTVLLIITAFTLFQPHSSFGWGAKGHGLVAEIAYSFLDSSKQQQLHKYLGETTIEQAATWMDEMRSNRSYDYMKKWHYVNIEKGKQYEATKDDNIINALNNAISQLEHKDKLSNDEIKKNLMVIFHLTGDLHMPLHIGYEVDKGGNDIQVKYLDHQSNLHRVWDTEIIESEKISYSNCMALLKNFDKNDIESLKKINVEDWTHEPRSLLGRVYDFKDDKIDQTYVDKNKKTVETQLLIAGIRLSAVLDQVLKS